MQGPLQPMMWQLVSQSDFSRACQLFSHSAVVMPFTKTLRDMCTVANRANKKVPFCRCLATTLAGTAN